MKVLNLFFKTKKESGQSLVEFALVLPVLLFLIMGVIEFGWILNAQITLTSGAREGARAAVVSTVNREDRAFEAMRSAVESTSGVTLLNDSDYYNYYEEEDTVNNIRNAVIEVKGNVRPIIGMFVDNPFEISARAVMRIE